MKTEDYTSKPRDVKAVRITADNMIEAAEWCNGMIEMGTDSPPFIRVKTHRPQNNRQREAHIGDWLVLQGKNFKVYLDAPFRYGFDRKPGVVIENNVSIPFVVNSKEETPLYDDLVGVPKPYPRPTYDADQTTLQPMANFTVPKPGPVAHRIQEQLYAVNPSRLDEYTKKLDRSEFGVPEMPKPADFKD